MIFILLLFFSLIFFNLPFETKSKSRENKENMAFATTREVVERRRGILEHLVNGLVNGFELQGNSIKRRAIRAELLTYLSKNVFWDKPNMVTKYVVDYCTSKERAMPVQTDFLTFFSK
jgi:hypothetical protein